MNLTKDEAIIYNDKKFRYELYFKGTLASWIKLEAVQESLDTLSHLAHYERLIRERLYEFRPNEMDEND